jgi:fluoroacetyl-CoA thioesterase
MATDVVYAELSKVVASTDTAAEYGDHFPAAAATPFVLGLAEVACHNVVSAELAEGEVTVGVKATIEHLLPSPVGATLTAKAHLVRRDGRALTFNVLVFDGPDLCARVEHDRAVVGADRIAQRLTARESHQVHSV